MYNVHYSVVNASINSFETQLAPPRIASLVRAPLQAGYGRYNLYEAAITSVLRIAQEPVEGSMARAFSQVAVALSSGAFKYTTNIAQRQRWDVLVTSVPKASVWFLAIVCALYAFVSLVIFVIALFLWRNERIRELQRHLGLENVNDVLGSTKIQYKDLGLGVVEGRVEEKLKELAEVTVKQLIE